MTAENHWTRTAKIVSHLILLSFYTKPFPFSLIDICWQSVPFIKLLFLFKFEFDEIVRVQTVDCGPVAESLAWKLSVWSLWRNQINVDAHWSARFFFFFITSTNQIQSHCDLQRWFLYFLLSVNSTTRLTMYIPKRCLFSNVRSYNVALVFY